MTNSAAIMCNRHFLKNNSTCLTILLKDQYISWHLHLKKICIHQNIIKSKCQIVYNDFQKYVQ